MSPDHLHETSSAPSGAVEGDTRPARGFGSAPGCDEFEREAQRRAEHHRHDEKIRGAVLVALTAILAVALAMTVQLAFVVISELNEATGAPVEHHR